MNSGGTTIIKVTCDQCGDVFLTPSDLERGDDYFMFTHCGYFQRKQANERVKAVLSVTGVRDVVEDFRQQLDDFPFVPSDWSSAPLQRSRAPQSYECRCGQPSRQDCYCWDRRPRPARTLGLLGILGALAGFWGWIAHLILR